MVGNPAIMGHIRCRRRQFAGINLRIHAGANSVTGGLLGGPPAPVSFCLWKSR
jgi:hypothetical protein